MSYFEVSGLGRIKYLCRTLFRDSPSPALSPLPQFTRNLGNSPLGAFSSSPPCNEAQKLEFQLSLEFQKNKKSELFL